MAGNEINGRVPMLEREQVTPEVGALYHAQQQQGVVPNMFKTVAHVPDLALGFASLLKPLLEDGALPAWYKELVATRISVLAGSQYAVAAHSHAATQKGATSAQIAAIKSDPQGGPFTDAEKVGLRCADRLHRSAHDIDDAFYAKLTQTFTDRQIIELIATATVLEFLARFVEALRIPVTPLPVERLDGKVH